tara:strand:+ start:3251 stop:3595 length:345 start_codon:yes stop_codon:yes gene_type:complete
MSKLPIEAHTTVFDYLKHLSSLCTASILLIIAFLEKLFESPEWKVCIAISLVSFVLSIISTVVAQAGVIEMIDHNPKNVAKWAHPLAFIGLAFVWLFFIVGLVSLVVFALKNLY